MNRGDSPGESAGDMSNFGFIDRQQKIYLQLATSVALRRDPEA